MKRFTPEEDKYILDNYLTIPMKRISKNLGRSEGTARQRLKLLGYKVPPEIVEKFKVESRFKKGQTPPNKGKKQSEFMSKEAIERTKKTRFKKGDLPHNTAEGNGVITTRKDKNGHNYKYIRLGLSKWELYHRVVWEESHGTIPEGHIVVFKDGDPMNCSLDNLELISLEENIKRNSGSLNLPDGSVATYLATKSRKVDYELKTELLKHPDLIELKRNQLLLNRAIKAKENDKI